MGLADWFRSFCSSIQVRDSSTISMRYKRLTKQLNTDFWATTSDTLHSLYVGSYGRNTAIRGFSDVDVIFQLPSLTYKRYNNYSGNGKSALLNAVKTSIQRTYSATRMKADGLVIIVPFTDGMKFELMPAFLNADKSYTYPDSNNGGCWKITNPRPEIQAIKDRNKVCNNNLIPLCRMMRAWKDKWEVPIGGLLIDTLAYQFLERYTYRDKSCSYYGYMCKDFFEYMAFQDTKQEYWRALGSGQHIKKKGVFQYKAKQCYNIAQEAIKCESAIPKREASAKRRWRKIFGNDFPE
jgi:hypothetical protein